MLRACPTCGAISCAAHIKKPRGSTRQWRNVRAQVMARDNETCHWCGEYATHADHVMPKSRGGSDDPANLVASCAACNLRRGNNLTN
jgi:5-methylcytosine-specific restriction endonuclease McrA